MTDPPRTQTGSEPDEDIMLATYDALCKHGYADLTIQRIADEYGKSTAAVHYHYDTKSDLLAAFVDYLLDQFVDQVHDVETTDPEERLNLLLDKLLISAVDHQNLLIALFEMQGQAPYQETFADRFSQSDEYIRYLLETVIVHGKEQGVFNDVDSENVARSLVTIAEGGRTRAVTLDDQQQLAEARQTADDYIDAVLLSSE
jgi:AcrR family transcriptional regulator